MGYIDDVEPKKIWSYPTSIRRAAELLDKAIPNWHTKINPKTLNMNNCSFCILGQLFKSESVEKSRAGYDIGMRRLFNVYNCCDFYDDDVFGCLADVSEWKKQITCRRERDAVVVIAHKLGINSQSKLDVNSNVSTVKAEDVLTTVKKFLESGQPDLALCLINGYHKHA